MTYCRTIYKVIQEDGFKQYAYLLDETLKLTMWDLYPQTWRRTAGKGEHGDVVPGMCGKDP